MRENESGPLVYGCWVYILVGIAGVVFFALGIGMLVETCRATG